jgi:hypothetical protein
MMPSSSSPDDRMLDALDRLGIRDAIVDGLSGVT